MGNLNICTRKGCNAILKGEAAAQVDVATSLYGGERKPWVLCPACVADVDTVLHTAPIGDRERAYEEPYKGWREPDADSVDSMTDEQLAAKLFERMMTKAQRSLESSSGGS